MVKYHPTYKKFKTSDDGVVFGVRGNPLTLSIHKSGYYLVTSLNEVGKPTNQYAHRFIWECFNNSIPNNLEINHINGIKTDNRLCNLELVTRSANQLHALATGLATIKYGEDTSQATITKDTVISILRDIRNGATNNTLSKKYSLNFKHISLIRNKKIWPEVFLLEEFADYTPIRSNESTIKLSRSDIDKVLKAAFTTTRTNKDIQEEFLMSDGQVSRIRHYKIWKEQTKEFIEKSSTTIPNGSRTKWFEAVSALISNEG
jgi:hypothetical protein